MKKLTLYLLIALAITQFTPVHAGGLLSPALLQARFLAQRQQRELNLFKIAFAACIVFKITSTLLLEAILKRSSNSPYGA